VAVDDARRAAVVGGPVVADGEAELVGLSRRLAEIRELPHRGRGPALELFLHPGVSDDEISAVEDEVAHQPLDEFRHPQAELRPLLPELRQGLGEAVRHSDVSPPKLAQELPLVVAWQAKGGSRLHHAHHQAEHGGYGGSAVDQVSEEDRFSPRRRCRRRRPR
jgi:hypothetical protein